jgi:hypothetical protein
MEQVDRLRNLDMTGSVRQEVSKNMQPSGYSIC